MAGMMDGEPRLHAAAAAAPKWCMTRRAPSLRGTTRPTFPSTSRSIPIAAVSMAASIVSRGPPTLIWACRRERISEIPPVRQAQRRRVCWPKIRRAPGYVPRVIAMGTNTDPISRWKRRCASPRSILEVLRDFRHPVAIITKSPLITAQDTGHPVGDGGDGTGPGGAVGHRLDRKARRRTMEPRGRNPARRLQAIQGPGTGHASPPSVMFAHAIPALGDHAVMEAVLTAARDAGAPAAPVHHHCCACRWRSRTCSDEWLEANQPSRAQTIANDADPTRCGAAKTTTPSTGTPA